NLDFMYIRLRLSEIYDTTDCDDGWFDKKHILLFGDLLQLPPVQDSAFIQLTVENIRKYLGSLSATNLWTLFDYDELTINMRQQGDESYRKLLSRIRVGLLTPSDYDILEKRKISFKGESFETRLSELCDFINNLLSDPVCLLPTCHMCNELNVAMLSRITSKEIFLIAEDTIDCISYMKKKLMDRIYVIRKQFSLCLSYDITIHKSQGLSLQNAVMDLGNNVFSYGQAYVALSRVTSLDGLHLINFDPSSVFASEKAIIEYNRLK
ncbi:DNA repair and recombination protein pif1, mitochondrial, partial [Trachymyrmex cornetzi]